MELQVGWPCRVPVTICPALCVWIVTQIYIVSSRLYEPKEYCQWEKFNATCRPNEVILMKTAVYGRMRFGRCVKEDHGNTGCSSNVLTQLDRKCSGRHTCEIGIPDPSLHNIHPCPKELVPYLEASYECLKVQSTSSPLCLDTSGLELSEPAGYLASTTPIEDRVGTSQCPWIIKASPGQRINLTLYGFGSDRQISPNSAVTDSDDCGSDIVVLESGKRSPITACGQLARERVLYISDTNRVHVYVESKHSKTRTNFLVKYSAVGCPDFTDLKYAWTSRRGDTAIVRCNFTGDTFFLSCEGSEWRGELGNCTKSTALGARRNIDEFSTKFPYGLLIVIGIGVALGVAFGILMLFGILFCLRRRREKTSRGHTMDPLLSDLPQDPDDTASNIYDKTRIIRCPHGLAAINLNPPDVGHYYPEGLERHPQVSLTAVSGPSPYSLEDYVTCNDRHDNEKEGIYYTGDGTTKATKQKLNKRKNDVMQTSFTTFRPSIIAEEAGESLGEAAYRSLQRNENSLDLLRDSRPCRELNPESLVECTCPTRHPTSQVCISGRNDGESTGNTAV